MIPISMIRRRLSSRSSNTSPQKDIVPAGNQVNNTEAETETKSENLTILNEDLSKISNSKRQVEVLLLKIKFCKLKEVDEPQNSKSNELVELRRKALCDLVDFMTALNQSKGSSGKSSVLKEEVLKEMIEMISSNLFQELSPSNSEFDPEEDDPILDPRWPGKQLVYEFLLRLIVCHELNTKFAKKAGLFDQTFLLNFIYLFESQESKERDYLKSILHRLYGKFFTHRRFIREQISFIFGRVVDSDQNHRGIAELLEILGSIINGFSLPLKKEHILFLRQSLLPLHKSPYLGSFQQQLSYCVTQFVEKDKSTAVIVVKYFISVWPWSSTNKQVAMLNELEEVLEALHPLNEESSPFFKQFSTLLYFHLSVLILSDHFQVAERALFLWNNQKLSINGILGASQAEEAFPFIYPSLLANVQGERQHWSDTVSDLSEKVLTLYKQGMSDEVFEQLKLSAVKKNAVEDSRKTRWSKILAAVEKQK